MEEVQTEEEKVVTQNERLTKRERNELRRSERKAEQEKMVRRKKIKSAAPWVIFIGLAVGGVVWMVSAAAEGAKNRPGEEVSIVGRDHVNVGDEHPGYNSNPPTSGAHAGPAPWGFSENEIFDENAIHNLEHGGIWISYKDLDDDSVDTLRKIARENSLSVVIAPRASNDSSVAIASWGRLMKMDTVDEQAITEFIRKNKNKSPEKLAR
tara:strand:+ start:3226 stop:3852 length:627 start_codon:yes stop_codon:yes gene_type:complete